MEKPSVFISYAREDEDVATEIYSVLKVNNWEIWMDKFSLVPGQDWQLEIQKAIENSNIFIACLSNNSVSKKGYVQKELRKALSVLDEYPEGRIFIIPIRLDDCVVPTSLSSKQWLNWNNPHSKEKLKSAIELANPNANIISTAILIEEMIKRETENWQSTGTYISHQRLTLILEKRMEVSPLKPDQAECVILSLWDAHFEFDGWEELVKKVNEEKIYELLHKWRVSSQSNKYAPNGLRLFLLRLLGIFRSDRDISLLGSPVEQERIKGIERLKKIEKNILSLLYCLYDDKTKVINTAIQELQKYGDFAIESIVAFVRNEKNQRQLDSLIKVVGIIESNNVEKVIPYLNDNDSNIRWFATKTLGEMRNPVAAPRVTDLFHDMDTRIVITAIETLGKIQSKESIHDLLKLFVVSEKPEILQSLAWTFGQYNDQVFIKPLKEMCLSENLAVKHMAIDVLTGLKDSEEFTVFPQYMSDDENIDLLIERVISLEINYPGNTYLESPNIKVVMEAIKRLCDLQSIKAIEPIKSALRRLYSAVAGDLYNSMEPGLVAGAQTLEPNLQDILDQLKKIRTKEVELYVENFQRENLPIESPFIKSR